MAHVNQQESQSKTALNAMAATVREAQPLALLGLAPDAVIAGMANRQDQFHIVRHGIKVREIVGAFIYEIGSVMGLLDEVGKMAGAVAAVEGTEKVDSDAGLLTKGIAAVAGFEGAGALESLVGQLEAEKQDDAGNSQAVDSTNSQA